MRMLIFKNVHNLQFQAPVNEQSFMFLIENGVV